MEKNVDNENYDYLFRIMILGDSKVGKTSVTRRFIKNSFKEEHELVIGYGLEKKFVQKDNKLIKLLIFDKVNASNPLAPLPTKYFLGKEGAIIVYESKYSIFDDKYDILAETSKCLIPYSSANCLIFSFFSIFFSKSHLIRTILF